MQHAFQKTLQCIPKVLCMVSMGQLDSIRNYDPQWEDEEEKIQN